MRRIDYYDLVTVSLVLCYKERNIEIVSTDTVEQFANTVEKNLDDMNSIIRYSPTQRLYEEDEYKVVLDQDKNKYYMLKDLTKIDNLENKYLAIFPVDVYKAIHSDNALKTLGIVNSKKLVK